MDISIIITNYNKAEFLSRSIRSALNQKHMMKKDYEIIVIDDYSKDNSVKIIKDFFTNFYTNYNYIKKHNYNTLKKLPKAFSPFIKEFHR